MQEAVQLSDARAWLANLAKALDARDIAGVLPLFVEDCYWRDFLSLTWNIKTMEGKPAIATMLEATLDRAAPTGWTIEKVKRTGAVTEAWFGFATLAGKGEGIFRLEGGKCRTILTTLQSLFGFEEPVRYARPLGTTHRASRNRRNWTEQLAADQAALGVREQPYCLVIGGGQGGIMLGARLKQLGVPTIIAEKNEKAGHPAKPLPLARSARSGLVRPPALSALSRQLARLYPEGQDGRLAGVYVKLMELNYWGSTEVKTARFDPARKCWTVDLIRQGRSLTIEPTQLVFATGAYGPPNRIELPGVGSFVASSSIQAITATASATRVRIAS